MTIQGLFERKQQVIAGMNELGNKVASGQYTAEQNEEFRKFDTELKGIDNQIEILKRQEQLKAEEVVKEGRKVESDKKEKTYIVANAGKRAAVWSKVENGGLSDLSEEERGIYNDIERYSNTFEKWFRNGGRVDTLSVEERAILEKRVSDQTTTTTAGGYTIPEGFSGEIDKQMQTISELLKFARIYRTSSGNSIPWPTNNDTSNTGELLSENGDGSTSSAPLVFGQVTLAAYKFSSKMIRSSNELIQDQAVNLPQFIGEQLGERVGKIFNSYATTGTGSSQPLGYMDATAGATEGKVSASASAITAGEIIDLMHSVDASYRNSPKAAFAMNDLILAEIKKLSFGTSVYTPVWLPSLRDGAPDTILGKPYFVNNAMASTLATENAIIAFGDWSRFVVRIVNNFSLRVLTERYAEFDQTAWLGLARMDSRLLNRTAIKYLSLT
jgi:HK97 family phage major capsid protein